MLRIYKKPSGIRSSRHELATKLATKFGSQKGPDAKGQRPATPQPRAERVRERRPGSAAPQTQQALPRNFKMGIEHQALMNASFCIFPRFYAASVVKQFPFRTGTRTRGPSAERAKPEPSEPSTRAPLSSVPLSASASTASSSFQALKPFGYDPLDFALRAIRPEV